MFYCKTDDEIKKYDVTKNPITNNYIGSKDLEVNLRLIDKKIEFNCINYEDEDFIFKDLYSYLSEIHIKKIMDMLVWRSEYAKEILCL